jgi:hypothetical protein
MANDELMMDFTHFFKRWREARIIDFDTKEPSIKVELYFKTGFHKGQTFVFQFFPLTSYPKGGVSNANLASCGWSRKYSSAR